MVFVFQCEPTVLPEPNHVMLNHLYALSIKASGSKFYNYVDTINAGMGTVLSVKSCDHLGVFLRFKTCVVTF